ncbi:MAG: tetratricopeptide repeat protein [Anaerolineales bacterium]
MADKTEQRNPTMRAGRDVNVERDLVLRDKHETHIHEAERPLLTAAPPRPPAHFTGREADLSKLIRLLVSGESVAITAVHGMGGIGKTALAQKAAEMLHPHFPGGVLWWTLGPQPNTLTALDVWARHADPRSDLSALPDAGARASVVRSMLAKLGRLCVILDDVWDEDSARVLLEAAPPECAILLTTRDAGLARALRCRVERLGALSADESVALLAKLLGPLEAHEPAARTIAAREIAALTEGLPLALELIAGLADSPADLPTLAQQLKQRQSLDFLKLGSGADRDHSVEACFALSYNALDPETQRRFRALGVFAPAPFDPPAIFAVWGQEAPLSASEARGEGPGVGFLRTLTRRALLTKTDDGAYTQHALLRAYALALLQRAGEHAECAARHAGHYRRFAKEQNWREVETTFEQITHGWSLTQSLFPGTCHSYADAVFDFLLNRGRWKESLVWMEVVLAQARSDKDSELEGDALYNVALIMWHLGKYGEATTLLKDALTLARKLSDSTGEAQTINLLGVIHDEMGQREQALNSYQQALAIHREVGNRPMEGTTLNNIGLVYDALGQKDKALAQFEQVLVIHREVGDRHAEGVTLVNTGATLIALERLPDAERSLTQAVALLTQVQSPDAALAQQWLDHVRRKLNP